MQSHSAPMSRATSETRNHRSARTTAFLRWAQQAPTPEVRQALLDEVVRLNMEVAQAVAAPYARRGVALEDLRQVAYAALVRAARDYKPDKAENFLSYAVPTMRGEIRKYFRDHGWMVRPPRRVQETQAKVFEVRDRLSRNGSEPTTIQMAEELDLEPAEIDAALAAQGCFSPTPLDRPCRDDSTTTVGELIPTTEAGFEQAEAEAIVRPALQNLSPRDRSIVQMRFFEEMTQQEIGDRIGVTQMQVSRLLTRIVGDLREQVVRGSGRAGMASAATGTGRESNPETGGRIMGSAAQDMTTAAQYPEGDVVRTLLEQHARIKTLFADIRGAGGTGEVTELFAELRALLTVHETAEQLVVRPVTMRLAGGDVSKARTEEEAEATRMLKELEKLDPMAPEFEAELGALERAVNDHAEAEEKTEFPALLSGCTAEQRRTMGHALKAAERVAPTHPHPKVAGSTAATLLSMPIASIVDRAKDAIRHAS